MYILSYSCAYWVCSIAHFPVFSLAERVKQCWKLFVSLRMKTSVTLSVFAALELTTFCNCEGNTSVFRQTGKVHFPPFWIMERRKHEVESISRDIPFRGRIFCTIDPIFSLVSRINQKARTSREVYFHTYDKLNAPLSFCLLWGWKREFTFHNG